MTLTELKESIHKKVDQLNDTGLLELVNAIVNSGDKPFIIPEHMKAGIKEGLEDVKNGHVVTMEEFELRYEKWLE